MIQKPSNWESVKVYGENRKLPVAAYECVILKAEIDNTSYGNRLIISFDICEGEYKDYYKQKWQNDPDENKRWKGVLRQYIPIGNGTEDDDRNERNFKAFITCVEESNNGYKWTWDENSLKGKKVGVLYRNKEWVMDGKRGWWSEPYRAITTERVRTGDYTLPNDRPFTENTRTAPAVPVQVDIPLDDLPF